MAAFHGKQGKVTFAYIAEPESGIVSNVTSWSIDATADVAVSTVMNFAAVTAATHWKEYITGYLDWTAIIECDLDSDGLDPDLATDFIDEDGIAVVLSTGTNAMSARKYSGNGIITGISVSIDKDDIAKVTYTVQGSGTLTEAAVAA